MLVRFADGRSTFIDFRERAPEKATRDMYLDAQGNPTRDSVDGWRAVGVPGSVRGFELAQSKYGSKKWDALIAPAIELASKGFPLSYKSSELLRNAHNLADDPESKRIFQKGGVVLRCRRCVGAARTGGHPQTHRSLRRAGILRRRDRAPSGRRKWRGMAASSRSADLQKYQAVERTPLTGAYRGLSILTAPLAQLRRHRNFADAGDARRQRLRKDGRRFGGSDPLHRRSHAPFFCRPQPISGRFRFRQSPGERPARSRLHSRAARVDRPGSRHSQRSA